ncbi:MAG: ABC transporter substrate-binding protein [Candidatus Peregrinibacteria bacterium]|nr:ABC transporter substrate-binding protein [Candidatus Peregrinibacteria bacterium]
MEENKNQIQPEKQGQANQAQVVSGSVGDKSKDIADENVFEYEESKGSKIAKYSFYTVFLGVFVWIGFNLFYEQPANFFLGLTKLFAGPVKEVSSLTELKVMLPYEEISFEPTKADPLIRTRLENTYDPLVRPDRDLRMRPALALSWGVVGENTWEFNLRPNVVFQDGSVFSAQDVVASLNRAMNHKDSELKDVLKNIDKVAVRDDLTVEIVTKVPDPMLLNELASVLIIPSEYEKKTIETPLGTGPYAFEKNYTQDRIIFKRFDEYWGDKPKFETVSLYGRSDISKRGNMLLNGTVDLLTFVPFDAIATFKERDFKIVSVPTLEIEFLLFNSKSPLLKSVENRNAIRNAIDTVALADSLKGSAKPINQYASNGVFGFNPNIPTINYDEKVSKETISKLGLNGMTLTMSLPNGLQYIGDYVKKDLNDVGINLLISYYDDFDKFMESVDSGTADLYFFGYQSSFGDANDFLKDMAYSKAEFNYGKYANANVDQLILSASTEMDPLKRRIFLQDAMKILVDDDPIGVPLIEYEAFYSFSDKIDYEPRIDESLYFDDVIVK